MADAAFQASVMQSLMAENQAAGDYLKHHPDIARQVEADKKRGRNHAPPPPMQPDLAHMPRPDGVLDEPARGVDDTWDLHDVEKAAMAEAEKEAQMYSAQQAA